MAQWHMTHGTMAHDTLYNVHGTWHMAQWHIGTMAHDTRRVKRKEVDLDTTLDKQLSQTFKREKQNRQTTPAEKYVQIHGYISM